MSTKAELIALAERVEALTGPCREVDDEVATVLFEDKQRTCIKGLSDELGGMWMFRYPNGSIGSSLRYTASLDAAMTLVPEGWAIEGWLLWPGEPSSLTLSQARLKDDGRWWRDSSCPPPVEAFATTPALALTAAALRARALMIGDEA